MKTKAHIFIEFHTLVSSYWFNFYGGRLFVEAFVKNFIRESDFSSSSGDEVHLRMCYISGKNLFGIE